MKLKQFANDSFIQTRQAQNHVQGIKARVLQGRELFPSKVSTPTLRLVSPAVA